MGWAFESVANELAQELSDAGIEVKVSTGILLTRDVAIRLPRSETTDKYRRLMLAEIAKSKEIKAAAIRAKQTSLL